MPPVGTPAPIFGRRPRSDHHFSAILPRPGWHNAPLTTTMHHHACVARVRVVVHFLGGSLAGPTSWCVQVVVVEKRRRAGKRKATASSTATGSSPPWASACTSAPASTAETVTRGKDQECDPVGKSLDDVFAGVQQSNDPSLWLGDVNVAVQLSIFIK